MKNDVVIAIIIGFFLGAIAALIVVNIPSIVNTGKKNLTAISKSQESSPTPTPTKTAKFTIEISEPMDNEIAKTNKITIKGKTINNSQLMLEGKNETTAVLTSADGSFTGETGLSEGYNEITITVYNQSGESISKSIKVFYTPEKL
jgi:hypothetical protein